MNTKTIIAVYDFRSKQEYIYKTNRMKEIIGASEIIKNAYRNAIKGYEHAFYEAADFSLSDFNASACECTVLYEGGGNIVLLFKGESAFLSFNNHFSMYLIENAPGLTLICGSASFEDIGTAKFSEAASMIAADLIRYRNLAPPNAFADVLPFTQIEPRTSLPVTKKTAEPEELSLSAESAAKRKAFSEIRSVPDIKHVQALEKLAEEKKGTESLIAVIYIDGNGMGKKVETAIPKDAAFEVGVNLQRKLNEEINTAFVDNPIAAIESLFDDQKKIQEELRGKSREVLPMRRIIGGGDEITVVCRARNALNLVKKYFESLENFNKKSKKTYSACAGIVICNVNAPFSAIYEIAEQCCENGKKHIKSLKNTGGDNNCYVDAFFCFSSITKDLDTLRSSQMAGRTKMPYMISGSDDEHAIEKLERAASDLQKINRTNVKALRDAAFRSQADFKLELERVRASCEGLSIRAEDLPVVCDAAEFFDIWFREE